jgi:hypothetical protein
MQSQIEQAREPLRPELPPDSREIPANLPPTPQGFVPELPAPRERAPQQYDAQELANALPKRDTLSSVTQPEGAGRTTPQEQTPQRPSGTAFRDPATGQIYEGQTHGDAIAKAKAAGANLDNLDSGFTTSLNKFVDDVTALRIAKAARQVGRPSDKVNLNAEQLKGHSRAGQPLTPEQQQNLIDATLAKGKSRFNPSAPAKSGGIPTSTNQAGAQDVPPASAGVSPVQPPSPESTPTSARVAPAAAK